ncbi:MAG: GNAT family N-acetyltransferase [Saprospiraceae bacterium]|nr:GNAT family N-acetyltransferase [Saprospiraceae bacterium]
MLKLDFDIFPTMETERLMLRQITLSDASDMFEMRSDPSVMEYIPRPLAKTVEDAAALIQTMQEMMEKKEGLAWGISFKNETKLIGTVGFYRPKKEDYRVEVGYQLNRNYWQQGITYEAVVPILDFAFEKMNCHSIEAVIDPKNVASERLLLKCGFVKEAHFRESFFWQGEFLDTVIYGLLQKDRKY